MARIKLEVSRPVLLGYMTSLIITCVFFLAARQCNDQQRSYPKYKLKYWRPPIPVLEIKKRPSWGMINLWMVSHSWPFFFTESPKKIPWYHSWRSAITSPGKVLYYDWISMCVLSAWPDIYSSPSISGLLFPTAPLETQSLQSQVLLHTFSHPWQLPP